MSDRITNSRVVRLLLHVPQSASPLAHWSLTAVGTRRGVPTASMLDRGMWPLRGPDPTTQEIWAALAALTDEHGTH